MGCAHPPTSGSKSKRINPEFLGVYGNKIFVFGNKTLLPLQLSIYLRLSAW